MGKIGNKELILIIGILLVIILVLIIVFKITGFAVTEPGEVSVYRLVDGNNVKLSIVSSENVLAIQENFSSEECKVINYSIEPEIEIFVFKETENTWILANISDNLIVELSYNFGSDNDIDCSVVSGKYFVLSGEALEEGSLEGEEENETQTTPAPLVPAGSGGGSGSGGGGGGSGGGAGGGISAGSAGKPEMLSNDIVEVDDKEELVEVVEGAIKKITGEENVGEIRKGPVVLIGILILIVISIIIFLVVSFSRKPSK